MIDSGVDPIHLFLTEDDGTLAVVSNHKTVCDPFEVVCEVAKVPNNVDTDTLSVGGHVAGIVAGRPTEVSDGSTFHGVAPGAKLVSLSTGAGLVIIGADAALNWVLANHEADVRRRRAGGRMPAADGVDRVWAAGTDGVRREEPDQPARPGARYA